MSRTAWSALDKWQIPPIENQLAIFRGTCNANIKTTIKMQRKHSFYSYNFQEDTFRDCGEISDWNTVKLSKIPMFPHRQWEAAATYCQAGFWKSTRTSCQLWSKPHAVFHGVCKITLTEVLATQMGVMRRSKKASSFELYKLNPLSGGSIAWEFVHCYTWGHLRIVTVRSNTVGQHS